MTKLLRQAFEKVQALPAEMQDQAAQLLFAFAEDAGPVVKLTPEEDAALALSEAAAARGDFATDEQVRAIWSKHGL